jgi:hypothetical protein
MFKRQVDMRSEPIGRMVALGESTTLGASVSSRVGRRTRLPRALPMLWWAMPPLQPCWKWPWSDPSFASTSKRW